MSKVRILMSHWNTHFRYKNTFSDNRAAPPQTEIIPIL